MNWNLNMLAVRMIQLMNQREWTDKHLYQHCKIGVTKASKIRCGRIKDLRLSTAIRLAETLGVSLDYLCGLKRNIMATKLPINTLPFSDDAETVEYMLPNGEQMTGTKTEYFNALLSIQYDEAMKVAASAAIEVECRKAIDKLIYPNGYPTKDHRQDGTDKYALESGWVLEFERRINVSIDKAQLPSIKEAVETLQVDPDSGEVPTLDNAISYSPKLSMSGYGNLRDDVRVLLNEALTFTPGTPGLKVVAPKDKAATKASQQKAKS